MVGHMSLKIHDDDTNVSSLTSHHQIYAIFKTTLGQIMLSIRTERGIGAYRWSICGVTSIGDSRVELAEVTKN